MALIYDIAKRSLGLLIASDVILFKASNGMKFFELCNKYVQSVTENQD